MNAGDWVTDLLPPGDLEFSRWFHRFRYSVFRLETLQTYAGSGEDEGLAAFAPDPAEDAWAAMLRAHRDVGHTQQRVHVVTEPASDYLAYELTWEYGPHAAAGEDIRIIPVTTGWVVGVPSENFWLFDSTTLFVMHYDSGGRWLGVEPVTDPARVAAACFARDAALHHSTPWRAYLAHHPELERQQTRVSKLELGSQLPSLDTWVEAAGAGPDVGAELGELLTQARIEYSVWGDVYRSGAIATRQAQIGALEAEATVIREYQPAMMPGIVQTPAYARELLSLHDTDAVFVETLTGEQRLEDPGEVLAYTKMFDLLRSAAAAGRDAVTLIQRIAADLRNRGE